MNQNFSHLSAEGGLVLSWYTAEIQMHSNISRRPLLQYERRSNRVIALGSRLGK